MDASGRIHTARMIIDARPPPGPTLASLFASCLPCRYALPLARLVASIQGSLPDGSGNPGEPSPCPSGGVSAIRRGPRHTQVADTQRA